MALIIFESEKWQYLPIDHQMAVHNYVADVHKAWRVHTGGFYLWSVPGSATGAPCSLCAVPIAPKEWSVDIPDSGSALHPQEDTIVCLECIEDFYMEANPGDNRHLLLDRFRDGGKY